MNSFLIRHGLYRSPQLALIESLNYGFALAEQLNNSVNLTIHYGGLRSGVLIPDKCLLVFNTCRDPGRADECSLPTSLAV
jgi:hypothetical protein